MIRRLCITIALLAAALDIAAARDWYAEAEEHYYGGRYAQAIKVALEGIASPETGESDAVELYSILGSSYARLGAFDKAADYMVRCYEYDKAHGEKEGLTSSLINLASMYVYAGKGEMAEKYALEAISNEESVGRADKLAMALGKACDVYHALGRDDKALEYANRAVQMAREKLDKGAQAVRRSQRAYPLVALKRFNEAFTDLCFAEDVFRSENNRQSLAIVCFQLAQEYGRRGAKAGERQYLGEAASLARDVQDLPLLQKIESALAESYRRDNPSAALAHYKTASALADSIARSKSDHSLELYDIEYQTARREETIQAQKAELSRSRKVRIALSVAALLLLAASLLAAVMVVRLRRSSKSLKESNAQKDFLFRLISHDLYSPAAARLGSMQMLRKGAASMTSEQLGKVFQEMEQQAKGELELLDNVLHWSGSRSGESVRFDLSALAEEVASQYRPTAALKDISISIEPGSGVIVVSNRSSVMLALRNLLSNAVKFSPAGSEVKVSVDASPSEACVRVSDQGIGIPEDKLDSLFSRENAFRRRGTAGEVSNGFGLAVSKELLGELGGSISVESREGAGSCFTIHLPNSTENA